MKRLYAILPVLALVACAAEELATSSTSTVTYFHGMTLIPGEGQSVIRDAAMIVDGGEIVTAGASAEVTAPPGRRLSTFPDARSCPFSTPCTFTSGTWSTTSWRRRATPASPWSPI